MSSPIARLGQLSSSTRIFFQSLPLVWAAAPNATALLVVLLMLQGLTPAVTIWLTKLIVDAVTINQTASWSTLGVFVGLWALTRLIDAISEPWLSAIQGNVAERLTAHVNLLVMRKAATIPDIEPFESAQFYDEIQVVRQQASFSPMNLVLSIVNGGPMLFSIIALLILLGGLSWWIPFVILCVNIPQAYASAALQYIFWITAVHNSIHARRMDYFSSVMLMDTYAKEQRLFDRLPHYCLNQYAQAARDLYLAIRAVRLKKAGWNSVLLVISVIGNVIVFWYITAQALDGRFSAGDYLLFIQALAQTQLSLTQIVGQASFIQDSLLFFGKLFSFLSFQSRMPLKQPATPCRI